MAKQIEGINGGFCGRVGTVIGYQWRGKWCMRSYPRHIHDARTPLQLEQRAWFKRAVGFASRLTEVLRTGLRERSKALHLTEGNLFVALNKQCLTLEEGRLKVDYENLVLSDGMVAPVGFGELELTVTEERFRLNVDFEANPLHLPAQGGDKVFLAALCEVRNESILAAPVFRRNGTIAYTLPACWAGSVVHVYGFVQDYTGEASASQYLGSVTLVDDTGPVHLLDGVGNLGCERREFLRRHLDMMSEVEVARLVQGHEMDVDVGNVDAHHGLTDLDAGTDFL